MLNNKCGKADHNAERLNPILISRFLLNLRQLDEPKNETQSRFNSQFSIPGFRVPTSTSIVGNMGAELDHGPAEEADNDSEDAGVESRNEASVDGAAENLPGAPFTADVLEVLEVCLLLFTVPTARDVFIDLKISGTARCHLAFQCNVQRTFNFFYTLSTYSATQRIFSMLYLY